jgi:hypothetical protein
VYAHHVEPLVTDGDEAMRRSRSNYGDIAGSGDNLASIHGHCHLTRADKTNLCIRMLVELRASARRCVAKEEGNVRAVRDVAAERRRLQDLGIVLGDDIQGDYSTLAQVRDPDGNLLTLATPPARPFPPA